MIVLTEAIDQGNANRTLLPAFEVGNHVRQENRDSGPNTSAAKRNECVPIRRDISDMPFSNLPQLTEQRPS